MRKPPSQLQNAKARFRQVVEEALQGEPQQVTQRGQEAVALSEERCLVLREGTRTSGQGFITHLLAVTKEGASAHLPSRLGFRDIEL